MKTLTTLIFSLIVLTCTSCKKAGDNLAITVDITVLNQQGQNLLASPALYTKDNIDLYYVVNGQAQPYSASTNKGFFFNTDNNLQWIRIDLNHDTKVPYPLTLVKFGNAKIDTIKAKFKYTESSTILETVWFNGVKQNSNVFTIIK